MGVCGESRPIRDIRSINPSELDLSCLKPMCNSEDESQDVWPGTSIPLPYREGPLSGLMVDGHGVEVNDTGYCALSVCSQCFKDVNHGVIPKYSLANGMFLGDITCRVGGSYNYRGEHGSTVQIKMLYISIERRSF